MKFSMSQLFPKSQQSIEFTEENPPIWLSSENTVAGSTMDMRWFWKDHVLKLNVGESIDTDFNKITRIE